jgi:CHAD domain-containing protein
MEEKKIKDQLNHFYTNEVDLFLERLISVKTQPNEKTIHELRVEIKKLRSVFQLLDVIAKKEINIKQCANSLNDLFDTAGKIREIQVNQICFTKFKFPQEINDKYKKFLLNRENELGNRLKKTINHFDRLVLINSKKQIKKLTGDLNNKKMWDACLFYLKDKTLKIKNLLLAGNNPLIIHKIRIQLKSIHTIASFLQKIDPSQKNEKTLQLIKQTGTLIGNWHDNLVLINSLERYFIKKENVPENKLPLLLRSINKIELENKLILRTAKVKLKKVVISMNKNKFTSPTMATSLK